MENFFFSYAFLTVNTPEENFDEQGISRKKEKYIEMMESLHGNFLKNSLRKKTRGRTFPTLRVSFK